MVELVLCYLVAKFGDQGVNLDRLNPKNTLDQSIWALEVQTEVSCSWVLVSLSVEATMRPMNDGDEFPTPSRRCGLLLGS